jgi:hypothetical protein
MEFLTIAGKREHLRLRELRGCNCFDEEYTRSNVRGFDTYAIIKTNPTTCINKIKKQVVEDKLSDYVICIFQDEVIFTLTCLELNTETEGITSSNKHKQLSYNRKDMNAIDEIHSYKRFRYDNTVPLTKRKNSWCDIDDFKDDVVVRKSKRIRKLRLFKAEVGDNDDLICKGEVKEFNLALDFPLPKNVYLIK